MRRILKALIATCIIPTPLFAEGCNHGLGDIAKPFVERAIQLRIDRNYAEAIAILTRSPASVSPSFCVLYELGRNYLNEDKNDAALEQLQAASGIASPEDRAQQAIFNIIGYTWLQKKDYAQASMAFERQLNDDQFDALPTDKKTKVFNNAGFTYMKLSQYPAAKMNFERALANGSKLAAANLAKLESLISVQTTGDINIPGIFSVSLHSQRDDTGLSQKLELFANRLNVKPADIIIYRRTTGMLSLTLGTNLSYAKAQQFLDKALASNIASAQIVSTANWQNVSYDTKRSASFQSN